MPMPMPGEKETGDEFMARFMADEAMLKEYPGEEQRAAVAQAQWRKAHPGAAPAPEKKAEAAAGGRPDAELAHIEGVECCHPGTFDAKTGQVTITKADLEAAVRNFKPASIPAILGHELRTDTPAVGWAARAYLAVRDKLPRLMVDLVDVPRQVAEWINERRYRKVSLGLSWPEGRGMVVKHVGLLGAHPPACEGLADIPEAVLAGGPASTILILKQNRRLTVEESEKVEVLLARIAEADVKFAAAAAKLVASTAANESAEKNLKAAEELLAARERETQMADLDGDLKLAVVDGRVSPAEVPALKALGAAMISADPFRKVDVELAGADGKPEKRSAILSFRQSLRARSKVVEMAETASADGKGGKTNAGKDVVLAKAKKEYAESVTLQKAMPEERYLAGAVAEAVNLGLIPPEPKEPAKK